MKKLLILFVGVIAILTVGCGRGSVNEISFNDYNKMIKNKNSFILFIGSNECVHCTEFKVTLDRVVEKYNVDFKYLDVANLSEEDYKKLSDDIVFQGTPTTVFIEKGKDNSCNLFSCDSTKRIDGALSYEDVIKILKNMKYIKG